MYVLKEFKLEESQKEEIEDQVVRYRVRITQDKIRKEKAKQKRLDKGLKTNRITTSELKMVIEHWFSNGRSNLKKSFMYVYDNTNKTNKEVDWVEATVKARHFKKELTSAFDLLDCKNSSLLKNSKLFNKSRFYNDETLSKRIRQMDTELRYEEALIEKDEALTKKDELIEELRQELAQKPSTWEEEALKLLSEGNTQKIVAEKVGKGIATIKRLVKANK